MSNNTREPGDAELDYDYSDDFIQRLTAEMAALEEKYVDCQLERDDTFLRADRLRRAIGAFLLDRTSVEILERAVDQYDMTTPEPLLSAGEQVP